MKKFNLFIIGVAILIMIGCEKKVDITEKNKAVVMKAWKAIDQGDVDAAFEVFSKDYVYHSPGSPDLHGLEEGVKKPIIMLRTAFPDIHYKVEDMIAEEDMVITISHFGFIKRFPVSGYRRQTRGGTGHSGVSTKEADFIEHLFIASTHHYVLIFTDPFIDNMCLIYTSWTKLKNWHICYIVCNSCHRWKLSPSC